VRSLVICKYHKIFFRLSNQEERIGRFMYAIGEKRDVFRALVGNSKGKRPLGRSRLL